jgi:N-acetylglucosamine-6-phosphate deacetylase
VKPISRYKLSIEAGQIIAPSAEGSIFGSIGNKPAKLHIGHDGIIAGWDRDSALKAEHQIGSQNCIVGPGFIDLHFHGYGDQSNARYSEIGSFMNPVPILERITRYGTTGCLATLLVPVRARRFFGIDLDARFRMLRTQLAEMVNRDSELSHGTGEVSPTETGSLRARLLGLNLEGPKLNIEFCGAIPSNSIWDATVRDIPRIIGEDEMGDRHSVRMMTVAPELDFQGDFSFIRSLMERGIIISLGHSAASLEQTVGAIKAGASHLTHFYNAMAPLSHREPGLVGAGLIDPRIYDAKEHGISLEVICDFIHINPAVLSLAINPYHLVAGVSDAVAHPEMEEGTYEFAGQRVTIFDGAVRTLEDGRLAGSAMTMLQTFRNLLLLGGDNPDVVKAFEMTSSAPAQILGLNDSGKIEKGRRADLIVLDNNYNLLYTIIKGEIAYDASSHKSHRKYPLTVNSRVAVSKPAGKEAVMGLRISANAIWCGYVTEGEKVTLTLGGRNGNPGYKLGFTGREAILDSASEAIVGTWRQAQKEGYSISALGIAASGLIHGARAVTGMNLPAWNDFDISRELIRRATELDASFPKELPVAVDNSSSAMAMAIARTRRLRDTIALKKGENFVFVKIGWGLGTGVIINERPISSIQDISPDYFLHLRQAIKNIHDGLPTLLHQTVLINRLVSKGELALMRTCDEEYPEHHLETLVSMSGLIHYARAEEKKAGMIFFRKAKIRSIMEALERDPYAYENTRFELEMTIKDIVDALHGTPEEAEHAAAVFERMGMALGSGLFSLANTLQASIRRVVILPQMGKEFNEGIDIMRLAVLSALTQGTNEGEWKVNFVSADDDLFILGGATLCYR